MKNIDNLSWGELISQIESPIILDVRTASEFQSGHLKGAKNLDVLNTQEFVQTIENMDKKASYFVYCRSGQRSLFSCQMMDEMGFESTYNLAGGIMKWDGALE